MGLSIIDWFLIWVILEINIYSILRIFFNKIEYTIFYFFPQSFSSIILLWVSIINNNFMIKTIIFIIIIIKIGIYPFFWWFLLLIKKINSILKIILLTVQKILPSLLMFSINYAFYIIILVSNLLITIYISKIRRLDKIFILRTSVNRGWILLILKFSLNLWFFLLNNLFFNYKWNKIYTE